jgi:hypothetical protein
MNKKPSVIPIEHYAIQYRSNQRWDIVNQKYITGEWSEWYTAERYKTLKTAKEMIRYDDWRKVKEEYRILHVVGTGTVVDSGKC